ncbi:MAG TPA: S9 family peptidase [Sulfolobales archaeon]|nr:S9 family peptidase [Sulfolobales archaeon]
MRRLGIDDVIRISRITDVRLSGKGDLAYIVSVADVDKNKYVSEIRILTHAAEEFYLAGEGDSSPRWSPSAAKLAFISRRGAGKEDKGSGVFVWGLRGEARRVAWFKDGVADLEWLDENMLVVLASVPRAQLHDPDGDYAISDRIPVWFDGRGFVSHISQQIHFVDIDSGRVSKITDEPNGIQGFSVCKDGIYYYTREDWRKPLHHIVRRLKPGGSVEDIVRGYTVSQISCIDSEIYMLAHQRSIGIASHYRLWRIDGSSPTCVSCGLLDRNIEMIAGDYMGSPSIIYSDSGRTVLSIVDRGSLRDIVRRDGVVYSANSKGDRAAYIYASPLEPPEVYMISQGSVRKISRVNEWLSKEVKLYSPVYEPVEVNGERIDGWVLVPEGGGKKPLILYIHGGPKGMYGYHFNPEMQLMASEGFIVAFCNPRGSDGYSEEFADIRGMYGEKDYEQIMGFLDMILSKYPVDDKRMVVTGISYGGYMTNVIITKTDRFAAAVSENGIADWIADYWASDIGFWFDPDQIGGTPIDNLEEYVRKSPAFHVSRVKTPLLLIHSTEDYRCFIDQSLSMHIAMLSAGKESRLVIFTKGSHGHSVSAEPRHRRKRLEIKLSWIKERLGLTGQSSDEPGKKGCQDA